MATKKNEPDVRDAGVLESASGTPVVPVVVLESAVAGGGAVEGTPVVVTAGPTLKAERLGQPMALDVFLRLKFGAVVDQGAGFAHFVSKQKPKPPIRLLKSEWEQLLTGFQNKRIGG